MKAARCALRSNDLFGGDVNRIKIGCLFPLHQCSRSATVYDLIAGSLFFKNSVKSFNAPLLYYDLPFPILIAASPDFNSMFPNAEEYL
jgi:hypothetical protein